MGAVNIYWGYALLAIALGLALWSILDHQHLKRRLIGINRTHRMATMTAFLVFGGLIGAGYGYYGWRSLVDKAETPTPSKDPIIEVAYDLNLIGLPIPIEPFTTKHIIAIKEGRKVKLEKFVNNEDKRVIWPTTEPIIPPEQVGKIVVSNQGNVALFNMSYPVTISIGGTAMPGGVTDVTLKLPLHDLPVGKKVSFYIVNQSSDEGIIRLSKEAEVQVQGETGRRQVMMQTRELTFFDQIPMLKSSYHKWAGNKILEPDQRKVGEKKRESLEKDTPQAQPKKEIKPEEKKNPQQAKD